MVEFNRLNAGNWDWLGNDTAFIDDASSKKYNVIIYVDGEEQVPVTPDFTTNHTYVVKSVGTVGQAVKTVFVTINVAGGGSGGNGGNVFTRYTAYANGQMQIDNHPTLIGDIGSNSTITVNSSTPIVQGTAYTPNVPYMDQWTWNRNAVAGGYQEANPAGTMDVAAIIPAMPTMAASGTDLATVSTANIPGGSYYYNGQYTMNNDSLVISSGQTATIYINGNLRLTGTSTISGSNLTIYTTGNTIIDNDSSIQAVDGGTLNLYVQGNLQLTNNTFINGDNVVIQTNGTINFNSNSSINKDSTTAVTRIFSNSDIQFTNYFELGGLAGLVATTDAININSSAQAEHTVFVAGSGRSQVTNNVIIGGIYTNGRLSINSSPTITFADSKETILQAVGLNGGTASVAIQEGTWRVE